MFLPRDLIYYHGRIYYVSDIAFGVQFHYRAFPPCVNVGTLCSELMTLPLV